MLKPTIVAAALLLAVQAASADALEPATSAPTGIILVAGGCGFGFHPNFEGVCVPNRRDRFYAPGPGFGRGRLPPPCPRGYYRDPDPARRLCYPRF